MIVVTCEQNSPDWFAARRGIPTASRFKNILTPKTLKLSASSIEYRHELLAEWMSGATEDGYQSYAMTDGFLRQPQAMLWYEATQGVDVEPVGFCFRDERRLVGCSPDALVGEDGGMEIKCPKGKAQVATLLTGVMPPEHIPQVQGCLWVTSRKWWDFVSFHPLLPTFMARIEPDPEYQAALDAAIPAFIAEMLDGRVMLLEQYGIEPKRGHGMSEEEHAEWMRRYLAGEPMAAKEVVP
jgi:hypothetical protein